MKTGKCITVVNYHRNIDENMCGRDGFTWLLEIGGCH